MNSGKVTAGHEIRADILRAPTEKKDILWLKCQVARKLDKTHGNENCKSKRRKLSHQAKTRSRNFRIRFCNPSNSVGSPRSRQIFAEIPIKRELYIFGFKLYMESRMDQK